MLRADVASASVQVAACLATCLSLNLYIYSHMHTDIGYTRTFRKLQIYSKWHQDYSKSFKYIRLLKYETHCTKYFLSCCHRALNFSPLWRCGPTRARASSFTRFLDHTQRRTTVCRTPLDEWSARRRDLCLTRHNTHNRQTFIPAVWFEPTISAGEQRQTLGLRPRGHRDQQSNVIQNFIYIYIFIYLLYIYIFII